MKVFFRIEDFGSDFIATHLLKTFHDDPRLIFCVIIKFAPVDNIMSVFEVGSMTVVQLKAFLKQPTSGTKSDLLGQLHQDQEIVRPINSSSVLYSLLQEA